MRSTVTLTIAPAAPLEIPPRDQIVHGPITFVAHCERHGLPYFGRAYVGYVPTSTRIGAAMLRRMVQRAARHGEGQLERDLASMIQVCVRPAGIALEVKTSHDCAGPRLLDDDGRRSTAAWVGRYRGDARLRAEFRSLCGA
jgi:GTP cyclohydrolase I